MHPAPLWILAFLAATASATAQEVPLRRPAWPPPQAELPASLETQEVAPAERKGPEFGFNAALRGRWSLPFGAAHRDVAAIEGPGGAVVFLDQHASWNDLFHDGWGADLEVAVYFREDAQGGYGRGQSMRYGAFLSYSSDHYEGDSESDDFGTKMDVEDLNLTTLLVGGKVEAMTGKQTFVDGRLGLGVVHYSSVEATFSGPLVPAFRTELFEDSYTFAFDVRGHGGIALGPLNLVAGFGFRWLWPPSEGTNIDLDSGGFMTFDLEVGVELGF